MSLFCCFPGQVEDSSLWGWHHCEPLNLSHQEWALLPADNRCIPCCIGNFSWGPSLGLVGSLPLFAEWNFQESHSHGLPSLCLSWISKLRYRVLSLVRACFVGWERWSSLCCGWCVAPVSDPGAWWRQSQVVVPIMPGWCCWCWRQGRLWTCHWGSWIHI